MNPSKLNTSGINPVEYKVLIRPIEVEEVTDGGIIIPQSALERAEFAQSEGKVIAVGAICFTAPEWLDCPRVGDTVLYEKYSGSLVTGRDGEVYRLINDKEIGAVFNQ